MKPFILCTAFVFALCGGASAQSTITEGGAKTDATLIKIHQVDILDQLLPLTLRKDQFGPLLTALEKVRAADKKIRESEDAEVAKVSAEIEKAYNDSVEKGIYPPRETLTKVAKVLNALGIRRSVFAGESVDDVYTAMDKVLDAGQKKVMANTVTNSDLGGKTSEASDETKIRTYIRKVILDAATYDILLKLRKIAAS